MAATNSFSGTLPFISETRLPPVRPSPLRRVEGPINTFETLPVATSFPAAPAPAAAAALALPSPGVAPSPESPPREHPYIAQLRARISPKDTAQDAFAPIHALFQKQPVLYQDFGITSCLEISFKNANATDSASLLKIIETYARYIENAVQPWPTLAWCTAVKLFLKHNPTADLEKTLQCFTNPKYNSMLQRVDAQNLLALYFEQGPKPQASLDTILETCRQASDIHPSKNNDKSLELHLALFGPISTKEFIIRALVLNTNPQDSAEQILQKQREAPQKADEILRAIQTNAVQQIQKAEDARGLAAFKIASDMAHRIVTDPDLLF